MIHLPMFRYAGLHCPNPDCQAFIVWKEIPPGAPTPTVRALDVVSGTCPACGKEYSVPAADGIVEIESVSKARHFVNE